VREIDLTCREQTTFGLLRDKAVDAAMLSDAVLSCADTVVSFCAVLYLRWLVQKRCLMIFDAAGSYEIIHSGS